MQNESGRNVAGVRTSHDAARDIHIDQLTLLFKGTPFLEDAGVLASLTRECLSCINDQDGCNADEED